MAALLLATLNDEFHTRRDPDSVPPERPLRGCIKRARATNLSWLFWVTPGWKAATVGVGGRRRSDPETSEPEATHAMLKRSIHLRGVYKCIYPVKTDFLRSNQAARPPGASKNDVETEGIWANFNNLLNWTEEDALKIIQPIG